MMPGSGGSMHSTSRIWLDGLREFAAEHRVRKPPREPASVAEGAAERMILAANLATVLAGWDSVEAARRASGSGAWLLDPDPPLVITTSGIGIGVVGEQLATGSLPARAIADRAVAVTELEYRLWCIRHPDDGYQRHVILWNWIKTRVPPERQGEFARHPLGPGEAYWLHRTGIAGAGAADRRDCHLWKWNGRHASLLEAFVTERGVREL
jgi:hypothetical protein